MGQQQSCAGCSRGVLGKISLALAISKGMVDMALMMLQDPIFDPNEPDKKTGLIPLLIAVATGQTTIVQALVDHPSILIDTVDEAGRSALDWATRKGEEAIVDILKAAGINPNLRNLMGGTALCVAAQEGMTRIAEKLLGFDNIDVNIATNDESTALFIAAERGNEDVLQLLLKVPTIDVNRSMKWVKGGAEIKTSPIFAASLRGHGRIVDILSHFPMIDKDSAAAATGNVADAKAAKKKAEGNGKVDGDGTDAVEADDVLLEDGVEEDRHLRKPKPLLEDLMEDLEDHVMQC